MGISALRHRRDVHWLRPLAILAPWLAVVSVRAAAQQQAVPIRRLGAITATFSDSLGGNSAIRALSDGRVLINDPIHRRLILLDSSFQHPTIVADTTSRTVKAYGDGLSGLLRFTGDSSLTVDRLTGALVIIDPMGKIARVIAMPGNTRLPFMGLGAPLAFDQAGHLVFPAPPTVFLLLLDPEFVGDTLMRGPDSAALLRQDVTTRRIDTIAMLQAPRVRQAVTRRTNGGSGRGAVNPMPSSDDWTVLDDGTIAVVRVRDYHIDWIPPNRSATSTPKIPTQWLRLTDSMKVAIMDSIRARDAATGLVRDDRALPLSQRRVYVDPSDLPDYRPPFLSGFTRSDAEGNVWVRVNRTTPSAGILFDVIARNGQVIDRVEVPNGDSVIGFGPGVVYLLSRTGATARLSRASIH